MKKNLLKLTLFSILLFNFALSFGYLRTEISFPPIKKNVSYYNCTIVFAIENNKEFESEINSKKQIIYKIIYSFLKENGPIDQSNMIETLKLTEIQLSNKFSDKSDT